MREGWKTARMSEVFELQMGKTPSRDNPNYWGGLCVWVAIGDMNSAKYISDSKEHISSTAVAESGIKQVPSGCVIMSFKLSVGKVAVTSVPVFTNEAIMAFKVRDGYELLPDYIYYYLKGYKWDGVNRAAMGLTLNKASISQGKFSYPKKIEQERIVAELDLLTGIIDKQKAQLAELDTLAQSIFYDMFGDPISNNRGWECKKVIDVVKLQRGYDLPIQDRVCEGKVPVYGSNGIVGYHDKSMVNFGVVTGRSGTLGKVYYCQTPFFPLNTTLFSIDTHGNNIVYLRYLLEKYDLKRFGSGTGVPTLNRNEFHGRDIIDVPISLQQSFAEKIQSIEAQKASINRSIAETQKLFDYTMDKYFG